MKPYLPLTKTDLEVLDSQELEAYHQGYNQASLSIYNLLNPPYFKLGETVFLRGKNTTLNADNWTKFYFDLAKKSAYHSQIAQKYDDGKGFNMFHMGVHDGIIAYFEKMNS